MIRYIPLSGLVMTAQALSTTILVASLIGCGGSELPPPRATAGETSSPTSATQINTPTRSEPSGHASEQASATDPIRQSMSRLYKKCELVRAELEHTARRAQRRERGARAAAALSPASESPDPGADSPLRQRNAKKRYSAKQRIQRINQGIDDLDAFLFSNPNSEDWSEDKQDTWKRLYARLDARCSE